MTFMPAHKDTKTPAGQLRNDVTLADYIARKQDPAPKLHFAQWYTLNKHRIGFDYDGAHIVWNAAQENI